MYARVDDGTLLSIGGPPPCARLLGSEGWLCPPDGAWGPTEAALCGYFEVVEVARPADTPTDTYDLTYQMVGDVPTQVWVARPKTQAEIDAATAAANDTDIGDKITTVDMPAMEAILAATNATINAGPAPYIKDIAKAIRRLDRRAERLLDGSD